MCILIVEDEAIILMLAEEALAEAGHAVLTASNAAEAFALLDANPGCFSCLVTDYNMYPGATGVDVAERMRKAYDSIPIVLATATGGMIRSEWFVKNGVELLTKPYGPEDLVTTVERLLKAPNF